MHSIFICYRPEDGTYAKRLQEDLVRQFGPGQVFSDSTPIAFRHAREPASTGLPLIGVMLVVMGPQWSEARDPAGHRYLDDPLDFVRTAISTALARNIPTIPVLVGGADFDQ